MSVFDRLRDFIIKDARYTSTNTSLRIPVAMRLSSLALFLGASALGAAEPNADADERQTSVFNGQKVPALLELTPDNFDTMVKASKNLVVKYFRYEQAINPSFSILC